MALYSANYVYIKSKLFCILAEHRICYSGYLDSSACSYILYDDQTDLATVLAHSLNICCLIYKCKLLEQNMQLAYAANVARNNAVIAIVNVQCCVCIRQETTGQWESRGRGRWV